MSDLAWVLKDPSTGAMIRVRADKPDDQRVWLFAEVEDAIGDWPTAQISFENGVLTVSAEIGKDKVQIQKVVYLLGENKDA